MDAKRFWDLIEQSRAAGDGDPQAAALVESLCQLPPEEILDFQRHHHGFTDRAYVWELWGAAYLVNGGCSDDGFHYFCCWLVAQGKRVFERAVKNPDTLAEYLHGEENVEDGPVSSAASRAYRRVTKKRGDKAFYDALDKQYRHGPGLPDLADDWDFEDDDEMRRRLPKLSRMYLDNDGGDE